MLQFRPHHFLCALGFEGKGYSDEFVRGFFRIVSLLKKDESTPIQVIQGADRICAPCPNREGDQCKTESKIAQLDRAHSDILGLNPGDTLTWSEAKQLLAEKMTLKSFDRACAPCAWKSMGVCQNALTHLKETLSA